MTNQERVPTAEQPGSRPHGGPRDAIGPALRIPRLSAPYGFWPSTSPAPAPPPSSIFSAPDIEAFVECVAGAEEEPASAHVAALIQRGVPVETIYLELLTPAARHLGELWSDDACDFLDVTIALGRLQRIVREISHLFVGHGARPDAGRVLLSCIPGEQHTLGLFMVSEFFVRDGWEVSLGAPVAECDLVALVRDEWFDGVGFSVACNSRVAYLSREIPRLRRESRNPRLAVMVGGRVFNDQPAMVARVHADASATDARGAPVLARRLIGVRPRAMATSAVPGAVP